MQYCILLKTWAQPSHKIQTRGWNNRAWGWLTTRRHLKEKLSEKHKFQKALSSCLRCSPVAASIAVYIVGPECFTAYKKLGQFFMGLIASTELRPFLWIEGEGGFHWLISLKTRAQICFILLLILHAWWNEQHVSKKDLKKKSLLQNILLILWSYWGHYNYYHSGLQWIAP